jgi:hypothetical protein
MNKNNLGRFFGVVATLAAAPHVHAQQAPRCSDLFDDAQRLACYDAAFGKPARPAGAAAAPRAPVAAPAAPATTPAPTVRAAPVAPPAAAPPAPVAPSAAPAAPAAKNVSAGISEVARRADGRFVVTLNNGQVWSQLERDAAAEVAVGDEVTVREGMLGSYFLTTRAGVRTRVKAGK